MAQMALSYQHQLIQRLARAWMSMRLTLSSFWKCPHIEGLGLPLDHLVFSVTHCLSHTAMLILSNKTCKKTKMLHIYSVAYFVCVQLLQVCVLLFPNHNCQEILRSYDVPDTTRLHVLTHCFLTFL